MLTNANYTSILAKQVMHAVKWVACHYAPHNPAAKNEWDPDFFAGPSD